MSEPTEAERALRDRALRDHALSENAEAHVQDLRRRLLDLRTGNRLIHFPHAARGRNYVRAVDELPEVLHKKLVDGRSLRILALPNRSTDGGAADEASADSGGLAAAEQVARSLGIDPSYTLPRHKEQTPRRHTDDALQTLLFPELHQKTLARIADNTRLAQEEQGIHTLFAAFGFLEWFETAELDKPRHAPLVLYPLKLQRERKTGSYEYTIAAHDEEAEVNLALSERLWRDYGLRLPAWEDEDDLAAYLARVEAAIVAQPRWKVLRWVTVSNFSFARISMYHDLDGAGWPVLATPQAHETFRALTVDRSLLRPARWREDSEQLPGLADALPSLVLDADSSQVAAIMEAMEDRNLVIKGPPGTGKSQTIANLIATSLARGQRVLFVAEKLAALEVVKARLDRAGLGEFCLELHSHRGTRKAVMERLAARLALQPAAPRKLDAQRSRSASLRAQLNAYAAALNTPHGALGETVHTLIWRRELCRAATAAFAATLETLRVADTAQLTTEQLDGVRHLLRGFVQAAEDQRRAFAGQESSLWYTLGETGADEEQLLSLLESTRATVALLRATVLAHVGPRLADALRLEQAQVLYDLTSELPAQAQLKLGLLERLGDAGPRARLGETLSVLRRRSHLLAQLERSCRDVLRAQAAHVALQSAAGVLAEARHGDSLHAARRAACALSARCDELTRGALRLGQLARFAGLADPDDAESVTTLRHALALLSETPREVWRALRSAPALAEEQATSTLEALARDSQALQAKRAALDQRVVRGKHDLELREHAPAYAVALRRPWWMAWVFRLFWAARALHQKVAREPGRALSAMADDLLEAQRVLDEIAVLEASGEAAALCGQAFRGLDTDFALLLRASAWAEGVRREFARLHPAASVLRALLLRGELSQLDTLLQEARMQPLEPLWELAARAQQHERPLSGQIEQEREGAARLLAALDVLAGVGLADELAVSELPVTLDGIAELSRIDAQLSGLQQGLAQLGLAEDPRTLELTQLELSLHAASWASERAVSIELVVALAAPDARAQLAAGLREPLAKLGVEQASLQAHGMAEPAALLQVTTLSTVVSLIDHALSARPLLRAQLRYLRERSRALETFARPVVLAAVRGSVPFAQLVEASEFLLYGELLQQASEARPILLQVNGSELTSMRTQYRELDREILSLQAASIAHQLVRAPVAEGVASGKKSEWSELALIKHELSKKMRHVPLRQLLQRAGTALGALKPCFMMSPLTVAQFLPQHADRFDLVVIDEASQMRPEDALGAIVRAKRAVVVGDPKQLPPTSFFHRLESTEDDEPELADKDEPLDQESILDLGVASFGDTRDLRWHYRSRHPSLIAFSNEHFYEGRLMVFPAPLDSRSTRGVQLVQTDGLYADSLNPVEAERIALGVQRHVRANPKLTLGVVAMNQKQKELIRQKIDALEDEAVRAFVDAPDLAAPFFVKSLENVQGDERDVIFVSLTYGPDPLSKKVRQNFGPINSQYGARRLNVLFTRARQRLVVFSSLRPEDVRGEEGASPGLSTLRKYLSYAERGVSQANSSALSHTVAPESRDDDDPFVSTLRALLERAGHTVVPRVGVQGFFISLGIKARNGTGFACGIECDGADYHAQRSVRDRDRLRHELLAAQGWNIVRVWSIDWFRAPEAARDRLLKEVASHVASG